MPRLTLQSKAFIALAVLLAALLLIFTGFLRLGLQRGLGPYAAEIELGRMDWLGNRLERLYAEKGSWQSLRDQPENWRSLQRPFGMGGPGGPGGPGRPGPSDDPGAPNAFGDRPPPPPEFARGGPRDGAFGPATNTSNDRPPPMPPGALQAQRLALVDASGQFVAGSSYVVDTAGTARQALRAANGETIGELLLAPPADLASEADRAFIAQQLGFVAWTGLAGLALALLLSWWLARRWLAPIDALVTGARGVAAGRLDTRVATHGDDELARLTHTFNNMAAQLGGMEASRRQWIADVAHELRTPLAAMRAEIEAVQDGVRQFDDKTALRLHRQVMRLIQLVSDLRASLDAQAGSAASAWVPLHPLAQLTEAIASMRPRFAQQQMNLDTAPLDALLRQDPQPLVLGDAQQLHQVFLNLLENSVRYSDAGGRLSIAAQVNHTQLTLHFDDTAPGVAAHDLPHLFERLYRAEASRTRATGDLGGSGLGLAICRAIVMAHGGAISAQPSSLGGLRITVVLPLLENAA